MWVIQAWLPVKYTYQSKSAKSEVQSPRCKNSLVVFKTGSLGVPSSPEEGIARAALPCMAFSKPWFFQIQPVCAESA